MRTDYSENTPIEMLFKQVDDAQKCSVAARSPYSVQQLVQCGIVHILKTQVYTEAYKEWITLMPMQQTWVHFKTHFLKVARLRSAVSATTNQLGYNTFAGGAEDTGYDPNEAEELHAAATHFAQASSAAQETLRDLMQLNKALQNELSALKAQYNTL